MNYVVEGGDLPPALVAPVAAVSGKHPGEVTRSTHARARKRSAGIGVSPGDTAVGGPENLVGVVVREASTAFVHAGDVHVACHQVTGNLDVADECGCDLYRAVPGSPVISGESDVDALAGSEVVPGDVHIPEVGRGWVVVSPTGLAIVEGALVNAEMGPASWVRRVVGLIAAEPARGVAVDPDGEPGGGRLVVEKNGVAKGI